MLGSLLFAAAIMVSPPRLPDAQATVGEAPPRPPGAFDKAALRQAMEGSQAAPAAGQTFRIEIPFVDGRKRNMPTFQSPARWVYDYRREQLDLIIGLGEITPVNYDGFDAQGLDKLPPLQTFVFDSRESRTQSLFNVENATRGSDMKAGQESGYRGYGLVMGDRSRVSSFGLAAPYAENGPSALPRGFRPLSIHSIKQLPTRQLKSVVDRLILVIEGETTDLGQRPPVFCGQWKGNLRARQINDTLLVAVDANQCFVTARITKVTVMGRAGAVLASWPR